MLQTKPELASGLRSPGDGGQSPSSNGRGHTTSEFLDSVPVKRGQHYYELHKTTFEQKSSTDRKKSSNFRSNSEEELDKLLAGLDKLTETLPDLSSVRSYSVLSGASNGSVKPDVVRSPDIQLSLIKPSFIAKQSSGANAIKTVFFLSQLLLLNKLERLPMGLNHPLNGVNNPKYKLLHFLTTNFFGKRRRR
jgi:hypothetical protein